MHIGWPEGIWITLAVASALVAAAKIDGSRDSKINFFAQLTVEVLFFGLLLWGGFFA